MTKIKDIIELAKATSLSTLPVQAKDDVLLLFVKQALKELYRKFAISVKTEVVQTTEDKFFYELHSDNVNKIVNVYGSDGSDILQAELLGSKNLSYKIISSNSFTINKPTNDYLIVMYIASPDDNLTLDDNLPMSTAYDGALLMYIAYLAHTTINLDNTRESDVYLNRYLRVCETLVMEGYKNELAIEGLSIQSKGFV